MEAGNWEIPRNRRYSLLAIAWAAVAVLTFPGIFFPALFPAGLFRVFGVRENDVIGHSYLAFGWLAYVVLTVAACLSRRRRTYFIIYTILCVLLAINIVGCRAFWSDFRGIQ
jgi:hypothetical protein